MEAAPTKPPFWKRKWVLYTAGILFGVIVLTSLADSNQSSQPVATQLAAETQPTVASTQPAPVPQTNTSKADAQKELDDLMGLSKKAGLITSYEFSDTATVVYADKVWFTQTAAFKKDFLAKVATLKKTLTGYKHFEVRDAYSDEKVAEVTSFSGSLEVYK
jgi:hypothetical protein